MRYLEAALRPCKATLDAPASTTNKGYTGRSRPISVSLPKAEKHQAICLAGQLELTDKEILRLAIISIPT
ncbi:hypothetical protein PMIT1323_00872 [Prochlorococcus marinus str. MIT 1323]|nr:hypothetical protein PMIT1323_00872 [Prochlorococcus marinus str. MIT 1323]